MGIVANLVQAYESGSPFLPKTYPQEDGSYVTAEQVRQGEKNEFTRLRDQRLAEAEALKILRKKTAFEEKKLKGLQNRVSVVEDELQKAEQELGKTEDLLETAEKDYDFVQESTRVIKETVANLNDMATEVVTNWWIYR